MGSEGAVQGVVDEVIDAVPALGIRRVVPAGRRANALERSDVKLRCALSISGSALAPAAAAAMLDNPTVFFMAPRAGLLSLSCQGASNAQRAVAPSGACA